MAYNQNDVQVIDSNGIMLICSTCASDLSNQLFYTVNDNNYCEDCHEIGLESCAVCEEKIRDAILTAAGRTYHPNCFTCEGCSKCLNGVQFCVDASESILCLECHQERNCPTCTVCGILITESNEDGVILHVISMDKTYHIACYKCEDCQLQLSSEAGRPCYPLDGVNLCYQCNRERAKLKAAGKNVKNPPVNNQGSADSPQKKQPPLPKGKPLAKSPQHYGKGTSNSLPTNGANAWRNDGEIFGSSQNSYSSPRSSFDSTAASAAGYDPMLRKKMVTPRANGSSEPETRQLYIPVADPSPDSTLEGIETETLRSRIDSLFSSSPFQDNQQRAVQDGPPKRKIYSPLTRSASESVRSKIPSPSKEFEPEVFERKLQSLLENKPMDSSDDQWDSSSDRKGASREPVSRKIYVPPTTSTYRQPTPRKPVHPFTRSQSEVVTRKVHSPSAEFEPEAFTRKLSSLLETKSKDAAPPGSESESPRRKSSSPLQSSSSESITHKIYVPYSGTGSDTGKKNKFEFPSPHTGSRSDSPVVKKSIPGSRAETPAVRRLSSGGLKTGSSGRKYLPRTTALTSDSSDEFTEPPSLRSTASSTTSLRSMKESESSAPTPPDQDQDQGYAQDDEDMHLEDSQRSERPHLEEACRPEYPTIHFPPPPATSPPLSPPLSPPMSPLPPPLEQDLLQPNRNALAPSPTPSEEMFPELPSEVLMGTGLDEEEKTGDGLSAAVDDLDELLESLSISSRGEELSDDDCDTITTVETIGSTATLDTMDDLFDDITVCSLDVTIPEMYDADESAANETPRCLTPTTPPSRTATPTSITPWLSSPTPPSVATNMPDVVKDLSQGPTPSTDETATDELSETQLLPEELLAVPHLETLPSELQIEEEEIKAEDGATTMATPPSTPKPEMSSEDTESEATDPTPQPPTSPPGEKSGENNVVCVECGQVLVGCIYYSLNDAVYCEVCVDTTLKDCCVCTKKIKGEILKAGGNFYHPPCFTCEGCQRNLDGVQFTRDATNSIFCIQCYQLRYCPRCAACEELITGTNDKGEILHIVSMDTTFHTECYKCEECDMQLSSEAGRACYPLDGHLLCQKCNMIRQTAPKSVIVPSTGSEMKTSVESGYSTLPKHDKNPDINKSGESDKSSDEKGSGDSGSDNTRKQKKGPPPTVKAKPVTFSEDDVFESDGERNEGEELPADLPPPEEIPHQDHGIDDVFPDFPAPPPVTEGEIGKKLSGICGKCGEEIVVEGSVYTAVGADMYHVTCYVCEGCGTVLTGTVFYNGNEGPFCESCGTTFEICLACENKIKDQMLKANNNFYHPECFACTDCCMNMNGMEFTVDESKGDILCINCYQLRYCPRCGLCDELITESNEKGEILHVVAMDKTFHMECYKCDECGVMLSSERGKACYPLDGHLLCQPCNIFRRRGISNKAVTSEL